MAINSFTGDGFVLTATADGTTIRGFVIRDFSGDGIEIQASSDGNTIAGNYIGRLDSSVSTQLVMQTQEWGFEFWGPTTQLVVLQHPIAIWFPVMTHTEFI